MKTRMFCNGWLVILMLACAATSWAAPQPGFSAAFRAYQQHDYPTALRLFKADHGGDSCYVLGIMYYRGEGVPADKKEAIHWLTEAAEKNHLRAQYNLGMIYDKGDGVPQDLKEAAKWYRRGAEKGHVQSQFNLGLMYTNGEGVPKDHDEAVKWLRLAARKGHVNARKLLKVMGEKY